MMKVIPGFVASLALLITLASAAFGQSTGALGGFVSDQSGAAVPNAEITLTNSATNVTAKAVSLGDGRYSVGRLIPGIYEIAVEAPGFKRTVRGGIEVHLADNLTLNLSLELGEARETVTVTETAALLRTEDAQSGELINNRFIANMPQLNRNPFGLLQLSGNVSTTPGTTGQDNSIQINGGRTSSVDFYVDGGVVNSGQSNRLTNQQPSMDAVAEFKVVTSGISAEFGRISGGYVTLVTKSGTNDYHGSLYEYMYNDMFNANSWAQNVIGAKKAHFRQNNWGFTLGGPVRLPMLYDGRNKTFFFIDNEYLKNTGAGTVTLNSVPNAEERAGNFTNSRYQGNTYPIYDPYGPQVFNTSNGLWERTGLLGGDGKHVPPSLISPVSVAILKLVPVSNRPAVANNSSLNNYAWPSSTILKTFRFGVKLDHTLTDKQRISFRYATFDSNQASTPTMDTPLYTSNVSESNGGMNMNLSDTYSVTPTTLIDVRSSMTHSPIFSGAVHPDDFNNSFLPPIYQKYLGTNNFQQMPDSFMGGTPHAQAGVYSVTNSTNYTFASTLTKLMSKHTVKFGGEHRRYYDNFLNAGSANTTNFLVDPVHRFQGDWGGAVEGRILSLASMLLGINNRNNIAQPATRAMNTNYFGLFIQDDWKLTPKLTVNLGFRYDNERPTTERHDKIYFWDPSHPSLFPVIPGYNFARALADAGLPADSPVPQWVKDGAFKPGVVGVTNSPEYPFRSPQIVSNTNFAPRVGLAYQLDKMTVLRAYGGKMYLPTTGNPNSYATANTNIALSDQAFAGWHASVDGGRNYISSWANPFPLASMFSSPTRNLITINQQSSLDPGANAVTRELNMAREYDWSFSVQRQLPGNNVVELGYVGNRGLGLLATDLISHYPADLFKPQYAAMMQKPIASPNAGQTAETTITGAKQQFGLLQYDYPYYGRVQVSGINEGTSRYNALTARLEHRFSSGLSFLGNYTRGKLLDDVGGADGQGGKGTQSIDSYHKAWGLSPLDRKHRLNLAWTYQFPFGSGQHWMGQPSGFTQKALDFVVGGWQFAGNYSFTTGTPLTLTGSTGAQINNGIKVVNTWAGYATSDHNLINPKYTGDQAALYSSVTPLPSTANLNGLLDPSKVVVARAFISGDLPPNSDLYRNPSFKQVDISLSKSFRLGEGKLFQFRAEAKNALNIRGLGTFQSQVGSPNYGLITNAGNDPRQIQLSARINF